MRRALLLASLTSAGAFGQQDPATPTFRASTKLVEVEVVAKRGEKPAAGLKKEDFILTDNGKRQNIAFFSFRSAKTAVRNDPETPLPPGTYSNRLGHDSDSPSRTTVILLDQINTPQEVQGYAIQRVRKYLESDHHPDRLAIYTMTWGGLHVIQDLTGNPELLKRAAVSLKARDPDPRINDTTGMSQHEVEGYEAMKICSQAAALRDSLKEIGRHLAQAPGRKNVVWVTTAFPLYSLDLGVDCRPEVEQAARALNNANIALYAVDARGLVGLLAGGLIGIMRADSEKPLPRSPRAINMTMQLPDEQNPPGFATEQMISGLTGGLIFYNKSNAIEESIETAVEDGDVTYTLGFYPEESTQDSKWHDLKVRVVRSGIQLRYRNNYFAGAAAGTESDPPTLERILREPLDSAQIELRAEAHPDLTRPNILNLKVTIDLHDVSFTRANSRRTGSIDLSFYLEGAHRIFSKPLKIEIPDSQFDAVLGKGLDAVAPIDITGASGGLRIVAQDKTTGAAGSLAIPLPAHQTK